MCLPHTHAMHLLGCVYVNYFFDTAAPRLRSVVLLLFLLCALFQDSIG